MFGQSSSSQSSGFCGSGALSHVYIQYPPLRCTISGSRNLFYDDGSKLLLAHTSDRVFSWKTAPFDPNVTPSTDSINEGPVLSIRYSVDSKLLAVQRSNHEVQIWNREGAKLCSYQCRSESEHILGFFWTDCPTCDIVFVKTSGLELFSYSADSKSLTLVETKKINVSWYIYTHESRLVLLAQGMQNKTFTGYQISSAGIIRLPKFEMAMAKHEANSKPVLAAEDVHVVTVYGRIYCLQFDRVAMLLHSYRFYRDAVIQQGSLPIYSNRIAVSALDNVLLVHQVDAKVVIMYDIFADSRAPISAPLPLLLRGYPRAASLCSQSTSRNSEALETKVLSDTEVITYGDGWTFLVPDLICDVTNGLLWKINLDLEAISSSSSEVPFILDFLQRRKLDANKAKQLSLTVAKTMILERRPVSVVARALDVLVTSYSQSIKTGSYFKRTKADKTSNSGVSDANNCTDAFGKSVKHGTQSGGLESESIGRSCFLTSDSDDKLNAEAQKITSLTLDSSSGKIDGEQSLRAEPAGASLHQPSARSQIIGPSDAPLNASTSENQDSQVTSAAISPDDLYNSVFAPVDEEIAGDASYLVAIIVEFLHRANLENLKIHPNIYVLTVQLLARSERHAELGLFITNKILEPSKEVALQLLESGRQNFQNFQTRKLGLDMIRQLSLHQDYVLLLVQDGYYLEALRYARKNKVNTVRPSLFLEAAYASNDPQHLAAVLRFFSDFIPGFKSTSDHHTYSRVLAEMSASVAA
ncbi:hypothetical protein ACH5RR_002592 [Cinchona calisaya]|uniref:Mic1 domain-containing protein n=1 Tax=Cinchona calisaya TaxID=153742 RepID=A0ABD3ASI2_9GENT